MYITFLLSKCHSVHTYIMGFRGPHFSHYLTSVLFIMFCIISTVKKKLNFLDSRYEMIKLFTHDFKTTHIIHFKFNSIIITSMISITDYFYKILNDFNDFTVVSVIFTYVNSCQIIHNVRYLTISINFKVIYMNSENHVHVLDKRTVH